MRAGHMPRAAALLGLGLALGLGVLSGCGSSADDEGIEAKTPTEILAASQLAAESAGSVHVSGAFVSEGTPVTLDLSLLGHSGARGRLSEKGLGYEVIRVGETIYIKGGEALYRQVAGPAGARLLAGRWLKASVHSPGLGSLASLTDLRTLIATTFAGHGTLRKGALTTIEGEGAIAITDRTKGGTVYIATTGLPYPLQLVGAPTSPGTISFAEWNGPVALSAPANALDIDRLPVRR